MNFLSFVTFGMIFSIPLFSEAGGENYDLEQIQTVHGRVYREIHILGADGHGLSFRHRDGIAKLEFSSLSENLRMLYEVFEEFGNEGGNEGAQGKPDESMQEAVDLEPFGSLPLTITVRNRVTFPAYPIWPGGHFHGGRLAGWPGCGHRYAPVHELVNPYYRELALRDFLYSSGLVPRPPGVFTYGIPRFSRSYFY